MENTVNAIELRGVTKRFGEVVANDRISMTLRKGEILSILPALEQTVLITKVWPKDKSASFHCVSVIRWKKNKIVALTEYWSDDGSAPQWRQEMGIGTPIREDAK